MPHYTMTKSARLLMGAAIIALSASPLAGQSAAERGLEIATEADRRDTGFGDSTAKLLMTLSLARMLSQSDARYPPLDSAPNTSKSGASTRSPVSDAAMPVSSTP